MQVTLGLGSNVGTRENFLRASLHTLSGTVLACSRVYESHAVLPTDAPPEWNAPYLNMAVLMETDQPPEALLAYVKALEMQLGRTYRGHWGPREIDIDILAMEDRVINSATLTIPHPQLLERDFALLPLSEVVPDWRYPVPGSYYHKPARELVTQFGYAPHDGLRLTNYIVTT